MMSPPPLPKPRSDLAVFLLNQLKTFNESLSRKDAYLGVAGLNEQYTSLYYTAINIFPKNEIEFFIPEPEQILDNFYESEDKIGPFESLNAKAKRLLTYVGDKTGNPIAQEYLGDALGEAEKALDQGNQMCAAIMTRVALEQALRSLCELKNIEVKSNAMAGTLNEALKDAGIFEKFYWRRVQSKIDFLSAPAHDSKKPPEDQVRSHINWVDNFVNNWLSGNGKQGSEMEKEE
jgi:hypothetical protein